VSGTFALDVLEQLTSDSETRVARLTKERLDRWSPGSCHDGQQCGDWRIEDLSALPSAHGPDLDADELPKVGLGETGSFPSSPDPFAEF